MRIILLALSTLFLITGCSSQELVPNVPPTMPSAETLPPAATNTALPEPTQGDGEKMTQPTLPPATSGLEPLIDQAKEDLAHRLSVEIDQISLIEAKEVVWPDASMGCPQPGMLYPQVLTDGALIILQVEGINYEYHSGGSRGLFLCENTGKDPNPPPKIDPTKHIPPLPD